MPCKLLRTLALVPFFILAGCISPVKTTQEATAPQKYIPDNRDSDLIPVLAALHDQMHTWYGAPYQWGGSNRNGVDCSGFVWRTLKDRFNLPLERVSTGDLLRMGVRINKQELRPGDLVFFRTRGGMHVGFYDTNHNFLHASTSRGVMRSSLDNPYWRSVYYQARRLPKEYDTQITMNSDNLHLAKNQKNQ